MASAYIFCPSRELNIKKINIPVETGDIFIAADSGIETALKLNINPNILIGDFDSVDSADLNRFAGTDNTEIIKYPAEKDDTDSMLAIKYSLERGYKNIMIIGGLDGRIDHTLANLFHLKYINKCGGFGSITNGYNRIMYLSESKVKIYKNYKYISVMPVSSEIRGVTLRGFRYCLTNARVRFEEPYTICNEISDDSEYGEIEVLNGDVLICECDDFMTT